MIAPLYYQKRHTYIHKTSCHKIIQVFDYAHTAIVRIARAMIIVNIIVIAHLFFSS